MINPSHAEKLAKIYMASKKAEDEVLGECDKSRTPVV